MEKQLIWKVTVEYGLDEDESSVEETVVYVLTKPLQIPSFNEVWVQFNGKMEGKAFLRKKIKLEFSGEIWSQD